MGQAEPDNKQTNKQTDKSDSAAQTSGNLNINYFG
jgi:hypothetical protein